MMKRSLTLALFAAIAIAAFSGAAMAAPDVWSMGSAHLSALTDPGVLIGLSGIVASSGAHLRTLRAKKADKVKEARALTDAATAADRDLTDEEQKQYEALAGEIKGLNAQLEREEFLAEQSAAAGIEIRDAGSIQTKDNRAEDPKHGFKSLGEFAGVVRIASLGGRAHDERLVIGAAAPTTFGNEASGADGGFLVPPEFARDIFNLSLAEDSLLPVVDNVTTSSNSMVFPKDETTPWGTDGVRAYWQSEAAAGNQTKPKLGTSIMRLNKLMALVPLSDELLADTNALDSYLPNLMGRSIRWKANEAFLQGDGNGQPLGMFKGAAAVTQSKDSGQAANTLTIGNITNMIARLPPGSFPRALWLITPDALPSLFGMTLGNYPVYLPMNSGAQGNPYGTLMGRPIMVSQHAAAFSSLGDVQLIDPFFYRALTSGAGVQMASSMHLYFDADATAFRATFRVDGQPKIAAAISQAKGSNTLSPFVQLQNR